MSALLRMIAQRRAVICALAAGTACVMAGCNGGGGGTPVNTAGLNEATTAWNAYEDGNTTGLNASLDVLGQAVGGIDNILAPSLPTQTSGTSTIAGLTFTSNLAASSTDSIHPYNPATRYSLTGTASAAGTVSGLTGAGIGLNGTAINMQLSSNVNQSAGTISLTGTVQPSGQPSATAHVSETLSLTGNVHKLQQTITIVSHLATGDTTIYSETTTSTFDPSVSPFTVHLTFSGVVRDPSNPLVAVTFTGDNTTVVTGTYNPSGTVAPTTTSTGHLLLDDGQGLRVQLATGYSQSAGFSAVGPIQLDGLTIGTLSYTDAQGLTV